MLVARALEGDSSSFAVLFRRHAPGVHSFAQRRTRSVDLADDIVSSSFEKGWRGLDQLGARHGDRFRPWVFRIAANEMASVMRSRARRVNREHVAASRDEVPADGNVGATLDSVADAVETSMASENVLRVLSSLPDRHQEVIALRYLSDLTVAETSVALNISKVNVAARLHRAVVALRDALEVTS